MRLSEKIRANALLAKAIPNLKTLGHYDPYSQSVAVTCITSADLEAIKKTGVQSDASREFLTTTIHELTHWLDSTSTLWGQRLLVDLHNAFGAYDTGDPAEFWRILKLENALSRGASAPYYATVDQPMAPVGKAQSWKFDVTCGAAFGPDGRSDEGNPIVFMSFLDLGGKRLCRVPLGLQSLLEANAMWAEIMASQTLLATVPVESQVVEKTRMSQELMRLLYTPSLTVYSAAVHLVARTQNISDVWRAYECASCLTTAVLNLPSSMTSNLRIPEDVAERWGARVAWLTKRGDLGFAFYLLTQAAPPVTSASFDKKSWLEAAFEAVGLPTLKVVESAVEQELSTLPSKLTVTGFLRARATRLLSIGCETFYQRGGIVAEPLQITSFSNGTAPYSLPLIVLGDDVIYDIGGGMIGFPELDVSAGVDFATRYTDWANGFVDACAI